MGFGNAVQHYCHLCISRWKPSAGRPLGFSELWFSWKKFSTFFRSKILIPLASPGSMRASKIKIAQSLYKAAPSTAHLPGHKSSTLGVWPPRHRGRPYRVRGGYWATFPLRKWIVMNDFFQSFGRQIPRNGSLSTSSTLYGLHFLIRWRTHGAPRILVHFSFPFSPSTRPVELSLVHSLTSGAELPRHAC